MDNEDVGVVLKKVISFLCCKCGINIAKLPDRVKAETQMMKFAEFNNGRVYKLLRLLMDPAVEYKMVIKHNVKY